MTVFQTELMMLPLRISVLLLLLVVCRLPPSGASSDDHADDHAAKAEATAALMSKISSSFRAAYESLTDLANIGRTLTHGHNQNSLKKGLEALDGVAKLAPFIDVFGSLVRFVSGFLPKSSPHVTYMKRRFRQVGRELDAISTQAGPLPSLQLWPSEEEGLLLNAWAQLEHLVAGLATAETPEGKTRAAERFTAYCESRGMEDSVMSFHRHITESSPVGAGGEGGSLLQLIWDKSEGDVRVLTRFSSYIVVLMIRGSFVNVVYDKLKSDSVDAQRTLLATERLLSLSKFMQRSLMDCVDKYDIWVRKDIEEIMTHPFSETRSMATDIKAHLDAKFNWFTWTVVIQDSSSDYGITHGSFITLTSQSQTVHLVPRDSEAELDTALHSEARKKLQAKIQYTCPVVLEDMTKVFPNHIEKQLAFAHAVSSSSEYMVIGDAITENCDTTFMFIPTGSYINTVVLKSAEGSELQCLHGTYRRAKDSSSGFCLCETMFYGHSCENRITNEDIDSVLDEQIGSVDIDPVPDITAVYFRVQEQAKHSKAQERFRWAKLRHQDVIDKLSFLRHQGDLLNRVQISLDKFVTNVQSVFDKPGVFMYLLFQFDRMLRGSELDEADNLLEALRELLQHPENPPLQPRDPIACSATYTKKLDDFVKSMSTLKSEAVSAWRTYVSRMSSKRIDPALANAQELLVGNGCGPLSADHLINNHCQSPYHSADQQRIQLKCSGNYKVFPETVQCSNGQWSTLPVCYMEPKNGATQCRQENGTTVCEASCDDGGSLLQSNKHSEIYQCDSAPCRPFNPSGSCTGPHCSSSSVCEDSEVCDGGRCVDGCSNATCGENAICATFYHVPVCTCVGPWVKNLKQQCRSPSLHWAQVSHIPNGGSHSHLSHT